MNDLIEKMKIYFDANPNLGVHYLCEVVFGDSDAFLYKSVTTDFEGMLARALENYIVQHDAENRPSMVCDKCDEIFYHMVHITKYDYPAILESVLFQWDVRGYEYLQILQKAYFKTTEEYEEWADWMNDDAPDPIDEYTREEWGLTDLVGGRNE